MLMLLMACSSDGSETGELDNRATTLSIYVYAPNHMLQTRGNTDWVKAQDGDSIIHTLQIWVFEHEGNGNLVGYFTPSTTDDLNTAGSAIYQMAVTPQFAKNKPNVDVYVLANVGESNCACKYDANSTRTQLEAAVLKHEGSKDPFGLTTLVEAVPADGLPMTGALRNQKVTGESPVLRVGEGSLATVRLVRAVSKVRFIFSQMKDGEGVMRVKRVTLNGSVLPKEEYLFLSEEYTGSEFHINTAGGYETETVNLVGEIDDVATTTDPQSYVYTAGMGAKAYEELIAEGLTEKKLTLGGLFYLRESDKKLTGQICYTINNGEEKTATFEMHDAGDFSRNHTWTVYASYGSTTLDILVVRLKEWVTVDPLNHTVYNW